MNHSSPPRPRLLGRALPLLALALSAGFIAAPAWAQAPKAGTPIGNQATATYLDGAQNKRDVQSNSVTTTVQQVAALVLTANRNENAAPGSPIDLPHTIQNTGNGADAFTLTAGQLFGANTQIFADATQDGVADNTDAITQTPSLQPGEKFNFVVSGLVPGTQAAGTSSSYCGDGDLYSERSDFDHQHRYASDTSTNAVLRVVKSLAGPNSSGEYTYTLTYTNRSQRATRPVTLTDVLNPKCLIMSPIRGSPALLAPIS